MKGGKIDPHYTCKTETKDDKMSSFPVSNKLLDEHQKTPSPNPTGKRSSDDDEMYNKFSVKTEVEDCNGSISIGNTDKLPMYKR